MTPDELEEIPAAIERLFYDQQVRVMEDVVRRIHKTGRITSTADYQIGKMAQQGKSTEWIESEIKRLGNLTDAEVRSLYDKVIQADYVRKRGLYEQVNANYTPYEDNKVMQKWVHALIDQTQGELKNISRSMGFSVPTGNGKTAFTPLADYYQRYIDRACMDIMTGTFDYNTVLRRVAKEMADSGLEYVSYASGHVDRATVAARRAVMTGVNQLSGQINMRLADELGTNYFEVSWHSGARPEHWWGGQVFSKEDLVDVCGYGEVTGLLGANCRHSFMPFVPGVSTRTYTDEQLAEMNAKERETKTYNGKEYNAYSATQRQRELERRMQKQRANIVSLKKGEGSKEDIAAAQAKYLKTLYQYRDFSKHMGLSPQMERVYVDRLGRVVNNGRPKSAFSENSGAKGVENRGGNGIIRVSQGSMAKARRPADAKERAQIINEAIHAKRPFYAEDLRQAYDLYGVKKEHGLYDVLIHGAPTFVEYEKKYVLDTETLYYIISGRKDYNGEDIRLLSCSTGKKDANGNCVAQELADLLNVKVYAPTDVLNIEPTGNLSVGKRRNGNFECFWKGKNMK